MAHVVRQRMAQMVGFRGNANRYRKFSAGAEPPKVPKEVLHVEKTQGEQAGTYAGWWTKEVKDDMYKVLTLGLTVFYGQMYLYYQKLDAIDREHLSFERQTHRLNSVWEAVPDSHGYYEIKYKRADILMREVHTVLPDQ
ncbi:hypothetical protein MKW94_014566 [Papaver nudicaule]|uniref:Uncharacterized protein n=1 Tax=Papaver nudicaule TaxID=74823 RepID=A0AA41S425_PAPNU|nr:hypothetical protein [Papaver nudicaule]